ncbi:hypothetical protein F4009_22740 [Candidatus Poribacteria bacterium]|nr:hypothetical protein [Candidatus Poribacteria bacterium]MYH81939.1 hypothetical protein [Candidatus Poribacteria bacterium]MYK96775.1 hypothetical protein [Candidatus Poribacteria bacterium]
MKKLTAFFTIALLVCIATFVAFASNRNRDSSCSSLVMAQTDDNLPVEIKVQSESNWGVDSQGPLYSSGSTGYWYYRSGEDLMISINGAASVSCSTDNEDYRTTYSVSAKVPGNLDIPPERTPDTLPKDGSFSHYVYRAGDGNGKLYGRSDAGGSASATGKDPNGDQHGTSAEAPTPATARTLYEY